MPQDEFWEVKKEAFLEKMQAQGLDFFRVKDFLEQIGLYSLNEYVLIQNINNPGYVNPLKMMP